MRAAEAEQTARGGRFTSARRLRRAIIRRTNGAVMVGLARRLSGVDKARVVYIVGRPTARTLILATRIRGGGVLGVRVTRRGVSMFPSSPAR